MKSSSVQTAEAGGLRSPWWKDMSVVVWVDGVSTQNEQRCCSDGSRHMVDPDVFKNKPGATDHSTDKTRHMVGLDVLRSDLRADGEICGGPTSWSRREEKKPLVTRNLVEEPGENGGGAEKQKICSKNIEKEGWNFYHHRSSSTF